MSAQHLNPEKEVLAIGLPVSFLYAYPLVDLYPRVKMRLSHHMDVWKVGHARRGAG